MVYHLLVYYREYLVLDGPLGHLLLEHHHQARYHHIYPISDAVVAFDYRSPYLACFRSEAVRHECICNPIEDAGGVFPHLAHHIQTTVGVQGNHTLQLSNAVGQTERMLRFCLPRSQGRALADHLLLLVYNVRQNVGAHIVLESQPGGLPEWRECCTLSMVILLVVDQQLVMSLHHGMFFGLSSAHYFN